MKIAFDAKRITHNSTGLGNYSRYIVDILSEYYPHSSYLLFSPSPGKDNLRNKLTSRDNITYNYPEGIKKYVKPYWRSRLILDELKEKGVDIFHGLSNELPLGINKSGIPSVVTIHDLIFLRFPHFYKSIDRSIYNYKFKRACKEADKVIAVSEMTRRDIINYYGIDENKIVTIYQGCDKTFETDPPKAIKEKVKGKYSLPERYILNVGTIESRKNLLLLLRALTEIEDEEIKVVVVGRKTAYYEEVEQFIAEKKLHDRVIILNGVTFAELPSIYRMATLFVYPSYFEGFGIPIIEALHSEVPVIAATGSCLEEAGGASSLYVNPDKPLELANKINYVLNNDEIRQNMINDGKEYVKRFMPDIIASQIMSLYEDLLKKKG